ncbi:hypothetical protein SAMN05446935_1453 [Burkholderia sp. YR290]|nr:hypothetical protein SAMN05446935_1453 [Burkholderia sp. YR290]
MSKAALGLPRWDDESLKAGTMVRTALWLTSEIGVGNIFTKEQHRKAFAGIAQADRRLRDLRKYGWVIHTSLEDVSLNANEQRLVKIGAHVWDPSGRSESSRHKVVSAKERTAIFARANYQCAVCGIAGGEAYPDDPFATAVLSISRRPDLLGHEGGDYVVECNLCRAGKRKWQDDIPDLLQRIEQLSLDEQRALFLFIAVESGSRLLSSWSSFCHLSVSAKAELKRVLAEKRSQLRGAARGGTG